MTTPRLLSLFTAAALSLSAAAQAPLFTTFGTGCTFDNQTLAIGSQGLPRIGQSFRITYAGPNHVQNFAQQIAEPQLGLGFTASVVPIPANLLINQPAGCSGYILPDATLNLPLAANQQRWDAHYDFAVPGDVSLVGVTFYAQWLMLHQQCGFAGCDLDAIATSDAAAITIGV